MRHVLFLAGVGLWLATLSGCGGGDSSSGPAVATNTPTPTGSGSASPGTQGSGSMTPGTQGSGSYNPGTQGSGSMTPGTQGSGSMTPGTQGSGSYNPGTQGSGSMTPGTQGSGSYNPGSQGSGSMTPGTQGSGSYNPGSQGSGSMTPGTQGSGSYNPSGTPPGGSIPSGTMDSATYQQQMSNSAQGSQPPSYGPGGTMPQGSSAASMPYGAGGQPGGDPSNPGYPGAGNVPGQQPAKPVTLLDIADVHFRYGHEQEGIQCLYGHAVTVDAEAAKEVLDKMGWIAPLKRPAMAVRWGIAVEYTAPRGYNGSVYPVGTTQNLPVKGAPSGQATGGQPPGGMGQGGMGAAQGNSQLEQLTGEVGRKVVGQLQERMSRGDFGQVMASLGKPAAAGAGGMAPGGGMPGYMPSGGGSEMSGTGMGPGYPGSGAGVSGQPQGAQSTEAVSLAPGIVMLGIVNAKDLREKGQKAGVDAVCVFNIVVTVNPRLQTIKNETTIHLHDLVQAKEVYESKTLNNIQIQLERADPKSDQDPVGKEVESLFKFVDANWPLGPLPAGLQAEHVLNRLKTLLAEPHENPLPILAEARMYQTRGLLQDSHYLAACQKLLGESEGTQLVNGAREEKLVVIGKWLPKPP